MRTILLAGLSIAVAALSGCGAGSHHAATEVSVHGTIKTVGGPPPGAPRAIAGARFRLVGRRTSVAVQANGQGRFDTALAPGTYRVELTAHVPMADGRPLSAVPGHVHITRGSASAIDLVVNIK